MIHMKKMLLWLLAITIILSLFGCSKETPVDNDAKEELTTFSEEKPSNQEQIPTNALIQADIQSALAQENGYATITDLEIIKSKTGDTSYSATVSITAETKYADWIYEVDMYYTKYDQGWIMDSTVWISENYTLSRFPSNEYLTGRVNEVLSTMSDQYSTLVPVSGAIKNTGENGDTVCLENECLVYEWDVFVQLLHGDYTQHYRSYWSYAKETDSWELQEKENHDAIECLEDPLNTYDVNFVGDWEWVRITDFSWNSITLSWYDAWDEEWTEAITFKKGTDSPYGTTNTPNPLWYYADNGFYMYVAFGEEDTQFAIMDWGKRMRGIQIFTASMLS